MQVEASTHGLAVGLTAANTGQMLLAAILSTTINQQGCFMGDGISKEQAILEISAGIYDTVLGNHSWTDALSPLLPLFHGRAFHLFFLNKERNLVTNLAVGGYTPEKLVASYTDYYGKIDPRGQYAARQPIGAVVPCHWICDDKFVQSNETYQDFVIPCGFRNTITGTPAQLGDETVVFGLMRPKGPGKYSDHEVALFQPLMQHVGRALQLQWQLQGLDRSMFAQQQALDALSFGVLVVDRAGRILHANLEAEQLLSAVLPLKVMAGKLRFNSQASHGRFICMLENAADKGVGGGMQVVNAQNGVELTIWAAPARDGLNLLQQPLVVLALVNPKQPVSVDALLRQAFGLTAAESKLAQALAAGTSISEYAGQQSVSIATVRTQVRAIYDKTGVSRQTELIRMLSRAGLLHG